jgi:hypothetical protein
MPIIGVIDSAKTGNLWPANSYESIATIVVGAGGMAAIDFNSIPSTYEHLQIRFMIRSSNANNDFSIGVNGSFSISNSSSHTLTGNGSSVSAGSWWAQNFISPTNAGVGTNTFPSGSIGVGVMDILDYKSTNKTKTFRMLWGTDRNGAGFVNSFSGSLNTTSAITAVNLFNGFNWAEFSSFALYGIKVVP